MSRNCLQSSQKIFQKSCWKKFKEITIKIPGEIAKAIEMKLAKSKYVCQLPCTSCENLFGNFYKYSSDNCFVDFCGNFFEIRLWIP